LERDFLAIGNESFTGSCKAQRLKLASTDIIDLLMTFRHVLFSSKDTTQAKSNYSSSHIENVSGS